MADGNTFDDFYQQAVREMGTGAAAAPQVAPEFDFCSVWGVAKAALQYLETVVPFWAKLVIEAAIKDGDHQCHQ